MVVFFVGTVRTVPFARMLERINVGNGVEFFERRVDRTTIAGWRSGRHNPPQWAIERVHQRWQELESAAREDLAKLKAGPGRHSVAINLARYRARRA